MPWAWDNAHGALLPYHRRLHAHVLHRVPQTRLGDVQQRRDIALLPQHHLLEQPLLLGHQGQHVRHAPVEAKAVVAFAAHNDQALLRGLREV